MALDQERKNSFAERYKSGEIPWGDPQPPPEVIALPAKLRPGRALDLGSGLGRTSIFLAMHGWEVDGIEFVEQAVEESRLRAEQAGVAELARFHAADVTDLSFLHGPYDLAVDVGCMHSLKNPQLLNYRDGLERLLSRGAHYLLFAHLRDPEDESDEADRWLAESDLLDAFSEGFVLEEVERGTTQVADNAPWPSAWFNFRRL